MDLNWQIIWKSVFIVIAGIILLRISGRRALSQMTVATTIIMISIGELLAQGLIDNTVWRSIAAISLFLLTLITLEWLALKSPIIQKWISGVAIIVIHEGKIDIGALKKLRMTYNQLEMRLRQKGISHISDVQTATIEINGELGYELKKHAQPLTVGDMERLTAQWKLATNQNNKRKPKDTDNQNNQKPQSELSDLFMEPDQSHVPEQQNL